MRSGKVIKNTNIKTLLSNIGQNKLAAILVILLLSLGFLGWTFPNTQTKEFSLVAAGFSGQAYPFQVRTLHNAIILDITYEGIGLGIGFALISPDNATIYNATYVFFNGTYSVHFSTTNVTSGTWYVVIAIGFANVRGKITFTSVGQPWSTFYGV